MSPDQDVCGSPADSLCFSPGRHGSISDPEPVPQLGDPPGHQDLEEGGREGEGPADQGTGAEGLIYGLAPPWPLPSLLYFPNPLQPLTPVADFQKVDLA